MKNLILILTVTVFLSCSNSDTKTSTSDLSITEIGSGNLYGNGAEGILESRLLITNSVSWNALLSEMNSVNNVSDSFLETSIDFANYDVIVLFDQVRATGGFAIEATSVTENTSSIMVTVNLQTPTGIVPLVITQPFHIYKIAKTTKPVIFE
ncbi:protease complex subunit PrcB family protein [Flavobacterium sp.]|uniref:protease complex subunit PrcB family protein n=1 Tax=Flavobacterium sp. TaxID=239 RepID=UPI0037529864